MIMMEGDKLLRGRLLESEKSGFLSLSYFLAVSIRQIIKYSHFSKKYHFSSLENYVSTYLSSSNKNISGKM